MRYYDWDGPKARRSRLIKIVAAWVFGVAFASLPMPTAIKNILRITDAKSSPEAQQHHLALRASRYHEWGDREQG